MAFFGFSDITFDKGTPARGGPLGDLVKSDFETSTLRYPLDVGNYDKGHYMVFYIREQKKTAKGTGLDDSLIDSGAGISPGGVSTKTALNNLRDFSVASEINNALNKLSNSISSGINQIGKSIGLSTGTINNILGSSGIPIPSSSVASQAVFNNSLKRITGGSLDFLRTTQLTKDAIALYMPDTLLYSHSQSYDQLSLGGEIGGQVLAAGKSAVEAYERGGLDAVKGSIDKTAVEGITQVVGKGVANALGSGQTGQAILAKTGRVINPMLEMVYKSPAFRTFQFDFTFYPRDESEALEVQSIIERFRYHQAPALLDDAAGFLVPPSEFDIRFYYGGNLNPNIPGIATCVLTTIDLNYAPNGFAAYEVPGENGPELGRTGMPVAIQLTLQFQETTYLTKKDFNLDVATSGTQSSSASQSGRLGTR
jgi:hypothetical protein